VLLKENTKQIRILNILKHKASKEKTNIVKNTFSLAEYVNIWLWPSP